MEALRGVDLRIERGEFVAVMGASGSGKSTCMNILGCLDTPTSGEYWFQGVEVGKLTRNQRALLRRHYLGFVFQSYNLLKRTSAVENVELPLIYRHAGAQRHSRALTALKQVGLRAGRAIRRASFRAGSSSGWRSRGRLSASRWCCWRTSRRGTWIRRGAWKSCSSCGR